MRLWMSYNRGWVWHRRSEQWGYKEIGAECDVTCRPSKQYLFGLRNEGS